MSEIKDSGERREFDTGAVRYSRGQGQMNLLPLEVLGIAMKDKFLICFELFKTRDSKAFFIYSIRRS